MATIEAVLDMPIDDLAKCTHIQPHPGDLAVLEARLDVLLHKCLYCIHTQRPRPLSLLLLVFLQSLNEQPERTAHALLRPSSRDGTCVELFTKLNSQFLAKASAPFRRAVDMEVYMDVLQTLCGVTMSVRERIGGSVGLDLVTFMHDVDQHIDDYRLSRGCASALITLLRGSRSNKNRISLECQRLAEALQGSCDVFFQMQCVEILFRLYTHNVTVLAQSRISHYICQCVSTLPNDTSLLARIREAVDDFNVHYNSDRVLPFTILRAEAADRYEVCGHTTVYFSPSLFMIMLPGGDGRSVTIPLEHIRSIKLSKDHSLGLRLLAIPIQLSQLMCATAANQAATSTTIADSACETHKEGADILHIFLTQVTLQRLRASPVHYWIDERRRNAPYQPPPPPPTYHVADSVLANASLPSTTATTVLASHAAASAPRTESRPTIYAAAASLQSNSTHPMTSSSSLPPASATSAATVAGKQTPSLVRGDCYPSQGSRHGATQQQKQNEESDDNEQHQQQQEENGVRNRSSWSRGRAAATTSESEGDSRSEMQQFRGIAAAAAPSAPARRSAPMLPHNREAMYDEAETHTGEDSTWRGAQTTQNKMTTSLSLSSSVPSMTTSSILPTNSTSYTNTTATHSSNNDTSTHTLRANAHSKSSYTGASNDSNDVNIPTNASSFPSSSVQQLHHAAAAKVARMHEDQLIGLRRASDEIRQLIDAWQARNARDRDSLDASFGEDVTHVRRAEAELKAFAAEQVRTLNAELEEVQSLGESLKAEVERLREQVAAAVGKSEGIEESCLARLKRTVDTKMQSMQDELNALLNKADPLQDVEQQLLRQLDHNASKTDSRRERMTVGVNEPAKARRLDYS